MGEKTVTDDMKAIQMSVGIAFIFFESVGALSLGIMYLAATISSFFAPCVISRFSSERKALAAFSFEFCLFIGSFILNYPVVMIICSIIHGCCLASFWASQGVYLGYISDTTNRGKRTGTFWAIFMAGNIFGNICAYLILKFVGLPEVKPGWNGAISILFVALVVSSFIGSIILCFLPPAKSTISISISSDEVTPLIQDNNKCSVWKGMKNCYYLLTTPKFLLLTLTMFANGYIAIFVPSQMNRQVRDPVIVGVFMSVYALSEIIYSTIGAHISDKYGAYYVIILGTISQVVGQILMMINNSSQNITTFIIAYIFFGGADSCFQTQALALTLYYFPGLSSTANSCFRLFQFISGCICFLTTPLYVKDGLVTVIMFCLENIVMGVILLFSFVFLSLFIKKYKTSVEYDDVFMM